MHKHKDCCSHELKHCPVCDVVYCDKCGREWGKEIKYIYPWPYTITYTDKPIDYTYTISKSDSITTSDFVKANSCNH